MYRSHLRREIFWYVFFEDWQQKEEVSVLMRRVTAENQAMLATSERKSTEGISAS